MAEGAPANPVVEPAASEAVVASVEKKQRAPRRPKAVAEASVASTTTASAKPGRGRKKRVEAPVEAAPTVTKNGGGKPAKTTTAAVKALMPKAASKATKAQAASSPVIDGIAELLELEAENQRLRKALSDKLRAENADLRKRLGTN
jgi:putative transposase